MRIQKGFLVFLIITPAVLFSCSWLAAISRPPLSTPKTILLESSSPISGIQKIAVSPDGKELVVINYDNRFAVWDRLSGKSIFSLPLNNRSLPVSAVNFSPDGRSLLVGDFSKPNKQITIWNAQNGTLQKELASQVSYITSVTSSPDGNTVASGGRDDNTIRLWDRQTGQLKRSFTMPHTVLGVTFSSDGNIIRGADRAGTVQVYDIETGELIRTLADPKNEPGVEDLYIQVAFAPNGKLMARGDADKRITLWNLETGKLVRALPGHYGAAFVLAFSPNSRMLATVGSSGQREPATGMKYHNLRLWDVQTSDVLGQSDDGRHIMALAFTPDGKELITGSYPGKLLLWNISSLQSKISNSTNLDYP